MSAFSPSFPFLFLPITFQARLCPPLTYNCSFCSAIEELTRREKRWGRAGLPSDTTNEIKRKEAVRGGRWLSCHEVTCSEDIVCQCKGKEKRARGWCWCSWTYYAYLPHATEICFYCFYLHGRNFSAGRNDYFCCPPAFDNVTCWENL